MNLGMLYVSMRLDLGPVRKKKWNSEQQTWNQRKHFSIAIWKIDISQDWWIGKGQ